MLSAMARVTARADHHDQWATKLPAVGRSYSSSPNVPMPIKSIDVYSLQGSAAGRLIKTLPLGTNVSIGDVVAKIEVEKTSATASDKSSSEIIDIISPLNGELTKIYTPIQETVQVGDTILDIDTDKYVEDANNGKSDNNTGNAAMPDPNDPNQQVYDEDLEQLMIHLQRNDGRIQDDYFQKYLTWTDIERLQRLVRNIRIKIPSLRVKALTIIEYILELQHAENVPALDVATSHTELGILLYQLNDLDASKKQLQYALTIRKEALAATSTSTTSQL